MRQDTLEDIERDLSASFRQFELTPPDVVMSRTPAASMAAAQHFILRIQAFYHRQEPHPPQEDITNEKDR